MHIKQYLANNKVRKTLSLLLIIAIGLFANAWIIGSSNFFINDDYDWLTTAVFSSFASLFHIFPTQAYNDRPIGAMFIKLLYAIFGDNYLFHHYVLMMIHLANGLLVYVYSNKILSLKKVRDAALIATLAGIWFVAWPEALFLIGWDAGIFDLLGTTLFMLFLLTHLISLKSRHRIIYSFGLSFIFFVALRTKEMAITLPVIALVTEVALGTSQIMPTLRKSLPGLFLPFSVLVIYLGNILLKLGAHERGFGSQSPYYLSFNPFVSLAAVPKYLDLYLNPFNPSYFIGGIREVVIIAVSVVLLLLVVLLLERKQGHGMNLPLLSLIAIISIAPVLPLQNNVQRLYLYFPSVFLALIVSYSLVVACRSLPIGRSRPKLYLTCIAIAICLPLIAINTTANHTFRSFYLMAANENRLIYTQIKQLPRPQSGQTIEIVGDIPGYSPFQERLGIIEPFKIIFKDNSLVGKLSKQGGDCAGCYVIRYEKSVLTLIQR